ncbi:hypothetical protein [Algiphilus sp.]|uniref:hypothetical protein n=1 Tax=Algiphilus sp. TaxID=1872431 RepID=UPI003B51DFEA
MMRSITPLVFLSVTALGLSACSGGGSNAGSETAGDSAPSENTARAERVEGPLDAAQEPVSQQVFGQIAGGTAGTPLEPVVLCADQAITFGALDIGDAVLLALQDGAASGDPQSALEDGSMKIQAAAEQFATDLQNLLTALAEQQCASAGGDDGGNDDGNGDGGSADNPLAGTPLEPLGAALTPVLAQFPGGGGDGGNGETADLQALSDFYSALNQALQDGLSQVPPEAKEAPVLGGIFSTLSTTLNDLDALLFAVSIFDSADSTAQVQNTVNNLLDNVLTQVVPVAFIEMQAGMEGEFTSQIEGGVDQLTDPLSNLQALFDPLFNDVFSDALQPLIDPIGNQVLPAVLGPLTEAIAGGGGGGGDGGPTGTPLDAVLAPLADLLGGSGGGGGGTTVELPLIVATIEVAIGGESDPAAAIQDILSQLQEGAPA